MANKSAKDLSKLSDEALIKAHTQTEENTYPRLGLDGTAAGRAILAADADRRAALAGRALELWPGSGNAGFERVASNLLRANSKDWTAARLVRAVEAAARIHREHKAFRGFDRFPQKPLISAVERAAEREPLTPELRAALERWKAALAPRALTPAEEREYGEAETLAMADDDKAPWSKVSAAFEKMEHLDRIRTPLTAERKLIERLGNLLSSPGGSRTADVEPTVHIDASDAVGTAVAGDRAKGGRAGGKAWAVLLQHARDLSATTPSKQWSKSAAGVVAEIGAAKFAACVSDWFACAGKPAPRPVVAHGHPPDQTLLNDCSVELLKGLAWAIVAANRPELAPALGTLAEACYKKVPNKGPRNVKVANAATAALAALAKPEAAAQLTRLRLRVKHRSARAAVDKALKTASQKTGLSPDDLAEMAVPAFGLEASGTRREKLGDFAAELRIVDSRQVELRWFAGEKLCKSVPAAVRKHHADDLKRLKREAKDASTMLAAQALRIERLFMSDRAWPLKTWRERYLEHPLVGSIARRLVWQFDGVPAMPVRDREDSAFTGSGFVDAAGRGVKTSEKTGVSLWHPIQSKPAEVVAWREWFERHEVVQPFKQAHREIYVLTDAERRTQTYSNRFAAHILRQHQFAALCQQRGWDYSAQGEFDSHNVPTLTLTSLGLNVEFWANAVEQDVSPRGIYLYVATDQVRFGQPLAKVPAVVFSEVMRDVDLFVGVASVANDPTWNDGGPEGRYRRYWEKVSFGDLSESARTRKEVLERLLPRLSAVERFSLSDKFLLVRGQLRTYKIHLGSGNILMEPNDQYLCIVADHGRASSKRVFLPFEGDTTLSVILSKAFLLAADDQIKDPTITRQIRS